MRQKGPRKAERALTFSVSWYPPALKIERLQIDPYIYAIVVPANTQERLGGSAVGASQQSFW